MKTLFIFILIGAQTAYGLSPVPLSRSLQTSEAEYRAFLLSEPGYEAVSLKILKARPSASNVYKLREIYENAERSFISADLESAHKAYLELTELALTDDWNEGQRAMIFHGFLRAAQTTASHTERSEILRRAARFGREIKVDEKLFPPPLVGEYQAVAASENLVTIVLPRSYINYSFALLNGELMDLKKYTLRVPAGEFRLTLVSDTYAPVTRVFSASALKAWQPRSEPLVSGTCEKPQFHSDVPDNGTGLFAKECIASQKTMSPHQPTLLEQAIRNREIQIRAKTRDQPFYHSKWFWGALGAVALAVAIDKNRDRGSSGGSGNEESTVKEGF